MINNFAALYAMGMFRGGFGGYSGKDDRGQPKRWEYIVFSLTSLGFILCLIFGISYFKHMAEEKTYDGFVEYKWKEEIINHKTKKFMYYCHWMTVKFDSIPAKAYMIVTEDTYKTRLKTRVSFTLSNHDIIRYCYPKKETKHMFLWMLYIMYPLVYLILFFGFYIALIKYMFGKDSSLYKHKEIHT